mmetsp:Transcript_26418/g.47647  ORF Transcript_26418/g.47647 Transcript_26418/m.47647 type:complete len:202 (-) Transcript_26418:146-751(-)
MALFRAISFRSTSPSPRASACRIFSASTSCLRRSARSFFTFFPLLPTPASNGKSPAFSSKMTRPASGAVSSSLSLSRLASADRFASFAEVASLASFPALASAALCLSVADCRRFRSSRSSSIRRSSFSRSSVRELGAACGSGGAFLGLFACAREDEAPDSLRSLPSAAAASIISMEVDLTFAGSSTLLRPSLFAWATSVPR